MNDGPIYARGHTYRARAEARQRQYRAEVLGVDHGQYGHFLSKRAAEAGRNFALGEAFLAARKREQAGKGIAPRTFENMLSSQAMCFNVFAPLSTRLPLASEVLGPFVPNLAEVTAIHIEHTPDNAIFNDQTGLVGVDCDLLIEGRTPSGSRLLLVVETKFIESAFSICSFRKPGRAKKGQEICPETIAVRDHREACLYVRSKRYSYWAQSDRYGVLTETAVPAMGCPFAGQYWQPWVNLVLAHAEADARGAAQAEFAVCTSSSNTVLLDDGHFLEGFRALLQHPERVRLIDLELLLERLVAVAPPDLAQWAGALSTRYHGI